MLTGRGPNRVTDSAAAFLGLLKLAGAPGRETARSRLRAPCQPQRGDREAREADAEFLERRAARNGLGQALGQFIELVVHNFPSSLFSCFAYCLPRAGVTNSPACSWPMSLHFYAERCAHHLALLLGMEIGCAIASPGSGNRSL